MEFKLPFPTLKSLSSLRICLHWAKNKLGPFQNFPVAHDPDEDVDDYYEKEARHERRTHVSLDGLQIPHSLKAVVGDVLFGILKQLKRWTDSHEYEQHFKEVQPPIRETRGRQRDYHDYRRIEEVQSFHFDVFGRFDRERTLRSIFQKNIAEKNDYFSLRRMLRDAYDFWLLPEVDAIFRKMVATASKYRQSEILMNEPQHVLRDETFFLVYHLVEEDAAQYLKHIQYEYGDEDTIVLEREKIAIAPFEEITTWNFDAFKDHFDLFEPSKREAFIKDVLRGGNMEMKNQLDILTFLKQNDSQRNWMLEFCEFWDFWENMLMWPFTSLFIVTFEYFPPHLTSKYSYIFSIIVAAMPADERYGVVHSNLLVNYWSVLTTAEKKRMWVSSDSNYFHRAMNELKVKAPSLHETIKTELGSLMTATEQE